MVAQKNTLRYQTAIVILCSCALAVSLISPRYPREQWLQHVPTVVSLAVMGLAVRRSWLSSLSFTCLALLLLMHIVGARWIYSYVPYDRWCESLFDAGLNEQFGWQRNHYDRLMHFAFGLLLSPPLWEASTRRLKLSVTQAGWAAVLFVLAASAAYEIFEWLLAVTAAPEFADRYNGQQGDPWDAQKDMALALVGNLLATGCGVIFVSANSKKKQDESIL